MLRRSSLGSAPSDDHQYNNSLCLKLSILYLEAYYRRLIGLAAYFLSHVKAQLDSGESPGLSLRDLFSRATSAIFYLMFHARV